LLEFYSRDATTVKITYSYGGGCEELMVASAYLPYNSDKPLPTKEVRMSLTPATAGKSNTLLGAMPTHTTYYGAAPAPIQEEKASWKFW
jgi:hypothetical protein